ncbi:MAG: hypothetical protein H6822_25555 [Planctomycetaceae bacterium]|nr:hypothetical protein [Planctomycetaceae bacterium]
MPSNDDKASENPYEAPQRTDRVRPHNPAVVTRAMVYLLIVIAVVGILAALFLPPVIYHR